MRPRGDATGSAKLIRAPRLVHDNRGCCPDCRGTRPAIRASLFGAVAEWLLHTPRKRASERTWGFESLPLRCEAGPPCSWEGFGQRVRAERETMGRDASSNGPRRTIDRRAVNPSRSARRLEAPALALDGPQGSSPRSCRSATSRLHVTDRLSQRTIALFWAPLAATWLMMGVEAPFLAAVIARHPDATFNLAAYGVAYAFAILTEAPVIMLMSAATALVQDGHSFRSCATSPALLGRRRRPSPAPGPDPAGVPLRDARRHRPAAGGRGSHLRSALVPPPVAGRHRIPALSSGRAHPLGPDPAGGLRHRGPRGRPWPARRRSWLLRVSTSRARGWAPSPSRPAWWPRRSPRAVMAAATVRALLARSRTIRRARRRPHVPGHRLASTIRWR